MILFANVGLCTTKFENLSLALSLVCSFWDQSATTKPAPSFFPPISQDKISNMADAAAAPAARGGFGSRGDRGGERGRGRGRRGPRRGGAKDAEKEWQPVTKLGRLVKAGKIKNMEEIYLHSLPIKEYQIVDFFLPKLKDEVMKVSARRVVQKTCARKSYGHGGSG